MRITIIIDKRKSFCKEGIYIVPNDNNLLRLSKGAIWSIFEGRIFDVEKEISKRQSRNCFHSSLRRVTELNVQPIFNKGTALIYHFVEERFKRVCTEFINELRCSRLRLSLLNIEKNYKLTLLISRAWKISFMRKRTQVRRAKVYEIYFINSHVNNYLALKGGMNKILP